MAGIFGGGAPDVEDRKAALLARRAPAPQAAAAPQADAPIAGSRVAVRTEHSGICDVPSSRVLHAPGGASSMAGIFGGGAPAPVDNRVAKAPPSAAAPPANNNLAAGQRVAVRTEHSGICDVPSSRVLAVPGGQSSMAGIVGGVEDRKAALLARRAQAAAPCAETTNIAAP